MAGFLTNVLKRQKKGTFKKEKMKDEHIDVARTRKCVECGSNAEMRLLAVHPSLKEELEKNLKLTPPPHLVMYPLWVTLYFK